MKMGISWELSEKWEMVQAGSAGSPTLSSRSICADDLIRSDVLIRRNVLWSDVLISLVQVGDNQDCRGAVGTDPLGGKIKNDSCRDSEFRKRKL